MVIESGGSKTILIIRRLRCIQCKTIHHELPDMLMPYKRHCADTVEKIIVEDTSAVYCEDSTVRKIKAWWMSLLLYFKNILASLERKYSVRFMEDIKPKQIVRAVTNSHLWLHTRSACSS